MSLGEVASRAQLELVIYSIVYAMVFVTSFLTLASVHKLTSKVQRYASAVMLKTQELEIEQRKTDQLLYQMMPRMVADQLKVRLSTDPWVINSSPPSAAFMRQWIGSALVQIMGLSHIRYQAII